MFYNYYSCVKEGGEVKRRLSAWACGLYTENEKAVQLSVVDLSRFIKPAALNTVAPKEGESHGIVRNPKVPQRCRMEAMWEESTAVKHSAITISSVSFVVSEDLALGFRGSGFTKEILFVSRNCGLVAQQAGNVNLWQSYTRSFHLATSICSCFTGSFFYFLFFAFCNCN